MTSYLDSLIESRRAAADEIRGIVKAAQLAARAITPDEEARIEAANARYDSIKAEADRHEEALRRLAPLDAARGRIQSAIASNGDDPVTSPDPIRLMLAARESQHDFAFPDSDALRAMPEWRTMDLGVGHGAALALAGRAISDFANGSSLFMNDFAARVAVYQRSMSPWMGLATIANSDNGRPLVVPMLTGDPTVYTPGEGTAITPSDVTLSSVTVTPVGYKALMYVSNEAVEDNEVNLTNILARAQARAISLAYGSAFTTTVLAGISNGGTATGLGGGSTATFLGYEDFLDLKMGRAAPYRPVGAFVMANAAITKARKFTDKNGQYLWQPFAAGGQPDTLEGQPVREDPYLVGPGSATKSVAYGDWESALVIKASPIRVQLSQDFLFDKDQLAIRTTQRIGIAVQDPAAAAYLVSKGS